MSVRHEQGDRFFAPHTLHGASIRGRVSHGEELEALFLHALRTAAT